MIGVSGTTLVEMYIAQHLQRKEAPRSLPLAFAVAFCQLHVRAYTEINTVDTCSRMSPGVRVIQNIDMQILLQEMPSDDATTFVSAMCVSLHSYFWPFLILTGSQLSFSGNMVLLRFD